MYPTTYFGNAVIDQRLRHRDLFSITFPNRRPLPDRRVRDDTGRDISR